MSARPAAVARPYTSLDALTEGSRLAHVEQLQQLVVPRERVDVEEHGARRIADVRYVARAAGQLPDQPRIHGAKEQFAGIRARPRAAHVVEDPADLAGGKVRVDQEAC